MLVNITRDLVSFNERMEELKQESWFTEKHHKDMIRGFGYQFEGDYKLADGVFINYGFNSPTNTIEELSDVEINYDDIRMTGEQNMFHFASYGICDNFEQVLEKRKMFVDSKEKFVLLLTPIHYDHCQYFRPGKWGEYIGNILEGWEYLRDENIKNTEDKLFFVFKFFKVK